MYSLFQVSKVEIKMDKYKRDALLSAGGIHRANVFSWFAFLANIGDSGMCHNRVIGFQDCSTSSMSGNGTIVNYILKYGELYLLSEPVSKSKSEQYYALAGPEMKRLTKKEALEWLKTKSE